MLIRCHASVETGCQTPVSARFQTLVRERVSAKLGFARHGLAKRSFESGRSRTEFGNEEFLAKRGVTNSDELLGV